MDKKDNVKQTDYGYEITWVSEETYGGKILVFDKITKTDFWFNSKTEKCWFVNNGEFLFKWIDTNTGQLFEKQAAEGTTFISKPLMPCAIDCRNVGSITEVNNGSNDDHNIVIKKDNY
jgi:restriction endonuclease S subunit